MASKYSAEVLFKSEKTVICLTEEICMLDMLCSGMSYSIVCVGGEFSINESTYILNKVS